MSRRRRRIAMAVLEDWVVIAGIGGALWGVSGEWVLGVAVLLGQLGSTLMTYYRVDEGGISVRRGLLAYKIPWGEVRHVCLRRPCDEGPVARTASIHTRQGVRLPVRAIQRPIILFREVGRCQVEAAIDELNEMVVASSADAG